MIYDKLHVTSYAKLIISVHNSSVRINIAIQIILFLY